MRPSTSTLSIPLSPDEHCAVHHFIRRHGRRPSPDELAAALRAGGRSGVSGPTPVVVLAMAWRRAAARMLGRL